MDDIELDRLLGISTTGRDETASNLSHFPYEPTPYAVLERVASTGYLTKKNTLIDFGCGKGRVSFYLSYLTKCKSVGVEFYDRVYYKAVQNKETALSKNRVEFLLEDAGEMEMKEEYDRFFFFNPFNQFIFSIVLENILALFEKTKKEMILFFYYPSKEYRDLLESNEKIELIDILSFENIFPGDDREEVRIYRLKDK